MKQKIIFLDIDGTLTEPGENVPPKSAQEAIRLARENGHLVYLCTGRSKGMLKSLLVYGFDGYIASAGNYVVCENQVIFDHSMTEEQRERILRCFAKYDIYPSLECLDGAFIHSGARELFLKHAGGNPNSELMRWRNQLESDLNILSMDKYAEQPVYKIVLVTESEEAITQAMAELSDLGHFSVGKMDQHGLINGEVSLKGYDKGTGVRMACEACGISIEDSIGFGDSINDYEMLQTVGLAICMENGTDEMKAVADDICPSVGEDGLYRAFLKYGII